MLTKEEILLPLMKFGSLTTFVSFWRHVEVIQIHITFVMLSFTKNVVNTVIYTVYLYLNQGDKSTI